MKFFALFLIFISLPVFSKVWTYGIIGDAGYWNHNSRMVRDSLFRDNVKDLIIPGDNLYDLNQDYHDVWKNWTDYGFNFSITALGNHNKGYEEEMRYFGMPSEYYSKVIGRARYIVLNSDNQHTVREQASFLRRELERAREPFIFLVYHHPPFSLRHIWEERKDFHLATRPIIMRHEKKITGIFVGHDHIASVVEMGEIPVIVSGAVFETFQIPYINHNVNGISMRTRWSSTSGYYWTRMDINDVDRSVWINFVSGSKRKVHCSVRIAPRPLLLRPNCRQNR